MSGVADVLAAVADEHRRADAEALVALLSAATGLPPVSWGSSIIGFGSRHYRYESGREGDTAAVGFAARKDALVLYLTGGPGDYADLLEVLGPHRLGKGCLYVKRLDEVDLEVLGRVGARSVERAAVS
ncbi:DUF1801 domain-containing protein [Kineococcus sp. SYSU DK003]|uniref:DUF1801 domain-containing protein n=1 Tax=Kineococcus sp. SYSU DK003 TaxID=3383124 RepID=UPI003D7D762D